MSLSVCLWSLLVVFVHSLFRPSFVVVSPLTVFTENFILFSFHLCLFTVKFIHSVPTRLSFLEFWIYLTSDEDFYHFHMLVELYLNRLTSGWRVFNQWLCFCCCFWMVIFVSTLSANRALIKHDFAKIPKLRWMTQFVRNALISAPVLQYG